jgi:hypothetical protein
LHASKTARIYLNRSQRQICGASQRHLDRSSRFGQEAAEKLANGGGTTLLRDVQKKEMQYRTVVISKVINGIGICEASRSGSQKARRRAASHNAPDYSSSQSGGGGIVSQLRTRGNEGFHNFLVQPLHARSETHSRGVFHCCETAAKLPRNAALQDSTARQHSTAAARGPRQFRVLN